MAEADQDNGQAPPVNDPDSLNGLIARILNQLSLSAWLPGAFLISTLMSLSWFRRQGAVTFSGLGAFVNGYWIPVLVLALPALVVATLLTQAFAFEAIRTLEGYWRHWPASWLRTAAIWWHMKRKAHLEARFKRFRLRALAQVRPRLSESGTDAGVLLAVEADASGVPRPTGLSTEQLEQADDLEWWNDCSPWVGAKLLRFKRDLEDLPDRGRLLPTKLGNVLRAAEDSLENVDGSLEGYVMRNRATVPSRILDHLDQFRNRLDMYCILVFVSIVSAAVSVPLLWTLATQDRIAAAVALALVAWFSYKAAISSAHGYVTALRAFDRVLGKALEAEKPGL